MSRPVNDNSVLSDFSYLTNQRLDNIPLTDKSILFLIRGLNTNKYNGSDGIYYFMFLMCVESVVLPLYL